MDLPKVNADIMSCVLLPYDRCARQVRPHGLHGKTRNVTLHRYLPCSSRQVRPTLSERTGRHNRGLGPNHFGRDVELPDL